MNKRLLTIGFILVVLINTIFLFVQAEDSSYASNWDDFIVTNGDFNQLDFKFCNDDLIQEDSQRCFICAVCIDTQSIITTKYAVDINGLTSINTSDKVRIEDLPANFFSNIHCLSSCANTDGTQPQQNCMCGNHILNNGYCCVNNNGDAQISQSPITDCNELPELYNISGKINFTDYALTLDSNLNNQLSEIHISIGDNTADVDDNGNYQFNNVPKNTIAVSFSNSNVVCSKTINSNEITSNPMTLNIELNCSLSNIINTCSEQGHYCCSPDNGQGTTYSELTCPSGLQCYDSCSNSNTECTPNTCYSNQNAYCNSSGQFIYYDLTDPDNYTEYCDLCFNYDLDCNQVLCVPDGCNGICPDACSPEEDPDCGGGACDYDQNLWCNGSWTNNEFCQHCPADESCNINPVCGDSEITPGFEDCEFTDSNFNEVVQESSCVLAYCGTPDSDHPCKCVNPNYQCENNQIDANEQCETDDGCPMGYSCQNCQCVQECNSNNIEFTAQRVMCNNTVQLIATINCQINDIEEISFKLRTPAGDNTLITLPFIPSVSSYHYDYSLNPTQSNTDLTFIVVLKKSSSQITQEVTLNTGALECMFPNSYFSSPNTCAIGECDGNSIIRCEQGEQGPVFSITPCSDGTHCQENLQTNEVECHATQPLSQCLTCAMPFGIFFNPEKELSSTLTCESLLYDSCFFDVDYGPIDTVRSCLDINSCYDYKSSSSCENNPCRLTLNCTWKPYNNQTGKGVCVPKQSVFQECNNALSPKYNNVFLFTNESASPGISPNRTTKRVCSLFGDCFYIFKIAPTNNMISKNQCKNLDQLECSDFLTEQECTNNSQYILNTTNFQTESYSQNLISNKAKCVWVSGTHSRCIRDANLDGNEDKYTNQNFFFGSYATVINQVSALRDFIAPQTTLSPISTDINNPVVFGENILIDIQKTDNLWSINNITTYYCYLLLNNANQDQTNPKGDVSPLSIIDSTRCKIPSNFNTDNHNFVSNWTQADSNINFQTNNEGKYLIYYFSVDKSLNIEAINYTYVYSNLSKPRIVFNYSIEVIKRPDKYLNNLYINFTVSPKSRCIASLSRASNPNIPIDPLKDINSTGTRFVTDYPLLEDDIYRYNITCTDTTLHNSITKIYDLTLQADTRVFNVTPRYKWFKQNTVTYRLQTANPGDCYYSSTYTSYDDMKNQVNTIRSNNLFYGHFNTQDNLIHSVTLNLSKESKLYKINVACKINITENGQPTQELVENNKLDRIIYSEDYEEPLIYAYIKETGTDEDYENIIPNKWYSHPNITLICQDKHIYTGGSFFVDGQYLVSGCDNSSFKYYYSIDPTNNLICQPTILTNSNTVSFDIQDPDIVSGENNHGHNVYVCADAKDLANNIASTINRNLKLDGVPPNITLTVKWNDNVVDTIMKGNYNIIAQSNEPLSRDESQQSLSFVADNTQQSLSIVLQDNNFTSILNPLNYNALINYEGLLQFVVMATDSHGRQNIQTFDYHVDTLLPAEPTLFPIFNSQYEQSNFFYDLENNRYPVFFSQTNSQENNLAHSNLTNTYYINKNNLLITGFIPEDLILDLKTKSLVPGTSFTIVDQYNMTQHSSVNEDNNYLVTLYPADSTASFNKKGSKEIYLYGTYDHDFKNKYIMFDYTNYDTNTLGEFAQHKRTTYGNYSKYYKIIDSNTITYDSNQVTVLTLDVPLEQNILTDVESGTYHTAKIFYDQTENRQPTYFELHFKKQYHSSCNASNTKNQYLIRVEAHKENGFSSSSGDFSIFVDTQTPLFNLNLIPTGTISSKNFLVRFNISEDKCGSGLNLDYSSIKFYNKTSNQLYREYYLNSPQFTITSSQDTGRLIYSVVLNATDFANGDYKMVFDIFDYALNTQNSTSDFRIDTRAPTLASIEISKLNKNCTYGPFNYECNPYYSHNNIITYSLKNFSSIKIGFKENVSFNATLLKLDMENNQILDIIDLDCYNLTDNSLFRCDFNPITQDAYYRLNITAYKLTDKYNLHPGTWTYLIKVDNTPPEFNTEQNIYMNSYNNIELNLNSNNPEQTLLLGVIGFNHHEINPVETTETGYIKLISPQEYGFTSEGAYNLTLALMDRANNYKTENITVTIDNTPPTINITQINSSPYIDFGDISQDIINFSTNNIHIFIYGVTVPDTKELYITVPSIEQTIIEKRCSVSEPPCIDENGNFEFELTLGPQDLQYQTNEELWNDVFVTVFDFANNQNDYTMSILLDFKPPQLVNTTIT